MAEIASNSLPPLGLVKNQEEKLVVLEALFEEALILQE
jgi:hypothetical protein